MASTNDELLSRYFTGVVCDDPDYRTSRKIRQVLPWLGFIIRGLACVEHLNVSHKRQVTFYFAGRRFKAKFDHAGLQSGVRIAETGLGQGNPELGTVFMIRSLVDAEHFYCHSAEILGRKAVA